MTLQPTQTSPGPFTSPGEHGSPPLHNHSVYDKGKKPLHQNRSWVRGRDPEPADGLPNSSDTARPSLLSRLESPSLLRRMAPAEEQLFSSSLVARLTDAPMDASVDFAPGEGEVSFNGGSDVREEGETTPDEVQVKVEESLATIPSLTATRGPVGKAKRVRSTIDVFGEPTVPTIPNKSKVSRDIPVKEENSPSPEPAPVNDTAVEALLATILPSDDPIRIHHSPEPAPVSPHADSKEMTPTDGDVEMDRQPMSTKPAPQPPSPSSLAPAVLEQCRNLLIPSIVQFAIRRNPSLDEETATKRALARLSSERCAEFIRLAKRMRSELQDQRGGSSDRDVEMSPAPSRSESKRPKDGDDDFGQPALKRLRRQSPDRIPEGPRATESAASLRSSTPSSRPILPTEESVHVPTTRNARLHVLNTTNPELASRGQSETVVSGGDLGSSSTSFLSRHSSLVRVHEEAGDGNTLCVVHSNPSPAISPPPHDQTVSAETAFLPSRAISRSARILTSHGSASPSPAATENADMFNSISAGTSHPGMVTCTSSSPPPTTADLPAAREIPDNGMHVQEDTQTQPLHQQALTLVPALWAAEVGKTSPDIQMIDFFVDDATAAAARHWARRKQEFSFDDRHVKVHLLCLSTATVAEFYEQLAPDASREEIVEAMWNMKTEWPRRGTLIIQTTPDPSLGYWIPDQDAGPLDITEAIRSGTNGFRLIQLADMSSKLFVFHATEPSEEERRVVGTETIALMRAFAKLSTQSSHNAPAPLDRWR